MFVEFLEINVLVGSSEVGESGMNNKQSTRVICLDVCYAVIGNDLLDIYDPVKSVCGVELLDH